MIVFLPLQIGEYSLDFQRKLDLHLATRLGAVEGMLSDF